MKKIFQKPILLVFILYIYSCNNNKDMDEKNKKQEIMQTFANAKSKEGFQTLVVLDGLASVELPANFNPLTEEEKIKKYPTSSPPQQVFANEDATISFALTNTKEKLSESDLKTYVDQIAVGIKQNIPTSKWYYSGTKKINNKLVNILQFETPAEDGWIHNIMCFTLIKGELIMYSFNCMVNQKNEWESKGYNIIASIKELNNS